MILALFDYNLGEIFKKLMIMNKILLLLALTVFLTSCFGGDDASVENPQVEDTVQEESLTIQEEDDDENEAEAENDESESETSWEQDSSTVREPVANEDVEIRETGTENDEYDVRANIESDPEASVVTEETFVVPTEPRAQEAEVEPVEISPEDEELTDDILRELLQGIDNGLDVITENE